MGLELYQLSSVADFYFFKQIYRELDDVFGFHFNEDTHEEEKSESDEEEEQPTIKIGVNNQRVRRETRERVRKLLLKNPTAKNVKQAWVQDKKRVKSKIKNIGKKAVKAIKWVGRLVWRKKKDKKKKDKKSKKNKKSKKSKKSSK